VPYHLSPHFENFSFSQNQQNINHKKKELQSKSNEFIVQKTAYNFTVDAKIFFIEQTSKLRGEVVLVVLIGGNHEWFGGGCFFCTLLQASEVCGQFILNSYLDARLQATATQEHASVIPAFVPGCLGGEKEEVWCPQANLFSQSGKFPFSWK